MHFDEERMQGKPMRLLDRYGYLELLFMVPLLALRKILEKLRIMYWRKFFGWKIGKNVTIHLSTHISRSMKVEIGDNVTMGRQTLVSGERTGGSLKIGDDVNIAQKCLLDITGQLIIEKGVVISEQVNIYTHSHGRNPKSRSRAHSVTIGDGVWIGVRAMVLSSARSIGKQAIIGAGEVVRSPVKANVLFIDGKELNLNNSHLPEK